MRMTCYNRAMSLAVTGYKGTFLLRAASLRANGGNILEIRLRHPSSARSPCNQ